MKSFFDEEFPFQEIQIEFRVQQMLPKKLFHPLSCIIKNLFP